MVPVLACPECMATAWEIYLVSDDVEDIRIAGMYCLTCGLYKEKGLDGEKVE